MALDNGQFTNGHRIGRRKNRPVRCLLMIGRSIAYEAKMKVAAVILNYNDADSSLDAVRRISGYDSIDTVIVVDNASTDDSADRIRHALREMNKQALNQDDDDDDDDEFHRYMLVENDENGGYAAGNNLGVKYAYEIVGAELVLLFDADCVFSESLVEEMTACFERDPDTAVVGALRAGTGDKVTYKDCIRSAWPLRSLGGELLNSGRLTRRLFRKWLNYEASKFIGHNYVYVDVVKGSLLMVDADRFMACEGFDEDMQRSCQENILAWKMQENGYRTELLLNGSYRYSGYVNAPKSAKEVLEREKQRQKSQRDYAREYLSAGAAALGAVRLFQAVVLLETWILQKLGMGR